MRLSFYLFVINTASVISLSVLVFFCRVCLVFNIFFLFLFLVTIGCAIGINCQLMFMA